MCNWMSVLPKNSKSAGLKKKNKNLVLSLKPCANEKTFYRLRLLAFDSPKSDRDDPHIVRYVHQIWGKNAEKGYPVIEDEVVCSMTPYAPTVDGRHKPCKICEAANKYYVAYKESNWKDKDANKKNKLFKYKYQAIVPVYVVTDPNYDKNNGKFKVIIFNTKEEYTEFRSCINAEITKGNNVFNSGKGVDCLIHVQSVPETYNAGTPDERVFNKKKYTFKFTSATKNGMDVRKEYASITKETIDAMEFDETYYTTSTDEEILEFYNKHCIVSNDDIPDDDTVQVFDTPKSTEKPTPVTMENTAKPEPVADNSLDDLDLETDPDEIGLDAPSSTPTPKVASTETTSSDVDIDDLDLDLDI